MAFEFTKAVKNQERLRLALDGPAGSGKTWTALIIATYIANQEGGRIAFIDSERSSAKKYAADFDFDHLTLPDFSAHTYMGAVRAADEAGYSVIVIDSFSHAWEGILEYKDAVTARSRSHNSYTEGWREATPLHNELVDTVLRAHAHVIATLRTKTEYIVEDNKPKKIGTKPIQRDGVDFEFDVVGDMDQQHTMIVSKSRCSALADAIIRKPDVRVAVTLWNWLNEGEPLPPAVTGEEADELRARLNALDGAARAEFKATFGHPAHLLADKLTLAREFVAAREGGTGGSPDTKGGATPPASVDDLPAPDGFVTNAAPGPAHQLGVGTGEKMTDRQKGRLFALLSEQGVPDRHAWAGDVLGRPVESFTTLTTDDATVLIDRLRLGGDATQREVDRADDHMARAEP